MHGWLVVNSQLSSNKFDEIYSLLLSAARQRGMSLELHDTSSPSLQVGDNARISFPDFAMFWDKDLYYAHILEDAGVRLFNTSKAVELCDDKALTSLQLAKHGIPIPKTMVAPKTFEGVDYANRSFLGDADIMTHPLPGSMT